MSRADDYEIRCDTHGCHTTVRLDDDPAALRPCGHIICDSCTFCDDCSPQEDKGAAA